MDLSKLFGQAQRFTEHAVSRMQQFQDERYERRIRSRALQVAGAPWWESNRRTFVCTYKDQEQLDGELWLADEYGWEIVNTDASGGHINIGRAFLSGGLSLLFKGGRARAKTTVTWRRH